MTRLIAVTFVTAVFAAKSYAAHQQLEEISIQLTSSAVPAPLLAIARAKASAILRQVGVRVAWNSSSHPRDITACDAGVIDISNIEVEIQNRARPDDHPGALGYSHPFAREGVRVVVFYDRVLDSTPNPSPELLGHVIAHEVGHMLIGTLSHAPYGVMRAHWQRADLYQIQSRSLTFTPQDQDSIALRFQRQRASCHRTVIAASRKERSAARTRLPLR